MIIEHQNAAAQQNQSQWQKLKSWFISFDEAMNYDHQAHVNTSVRQLHRHVDQLESRINDLEAREQTGQPPALSSVETRR